LGIANVILCPNICCTVVSLSSPTLDYSDTRKTQNDQNKHHKLLVVAYHQLAHIPLCTLKSRPHWRQNVAGSDDKLSPVWTSHKIAPHWTHRVAHDRRRRRNRLVRQRPLVSSPSMTRRRSQTTIRYHWRSF